MAELLRYPRNNIGPQDDYFKIQVLEYKAPGLGLQKQNSFALGTTEEALQESIKTSRTTIILPMPANIQDNNGADWQSGTMNPIVGNLASAGAEAVLSSNLVGSLFKSGSKFFENIGGALSTGEGQSAAAAGAAAAGLQAALGQGNINQIISRATGQVFNENVELLFNGVTIRPAFNFTFDMVPRSTDESEIIKTIIRRFKTNMTPRKGAPDVNGNGLFVKAPNVFKLEYMSGGKQHPFLHRFKPCALTQMSVNYNGSAQYATYPDATPVHMQLTLQFQELSPIYAENYDTEEGRIGVGY
ncbi:baseplate tail tube cap [Synechococcus phage S-SRM01]|uniref:Baseplate tail tube cap n=1 Tax=Synechococcus phage S-SRM01 TaxID=2781608 RepID=A0A879R3D1_9CAUD|nr:baseplate tail tube cap [Synechococcus phage S-SRM01]QPX47998.1 baseplate tail tube cap [Synechococcus phage S-SRM01]